MDNKMTAEQALESIEYAGHCAEQSGLIDCPERIRDAIPVLRAALSAPRVPDGWQSIDTADKPAPGDGGFGNRLLLTVDCGDGSLASVRIGYWDGDDWFLDCCGMASHYGYRVTHWRPLIAPALTASPEPVAPDAQQVIADLRAEVEALRDALGFVKIAILEANDSGIIADTLWATPQETLVDYIDAARLREGGE